jgi:hypothetical protein
VGSVHACPEGHIALLLGSSLFDSTDSSGSYAFATCGFGMPCGESVPRGATGIEDGGYMMTTLKECCEKMLSVHRPPDCGLNVRCLYHVLPRAFRYRVVFMIRCRRHGILFLTRPRGRSCGKMIHPEIKGGAVALTGIAASYERLPIPRY